MGKDETDGWLERVYHATDRDSLRAMYDSWAETYDADLQQVGYLHVPVITGLVALHMPSREAAILDAGVGTGSIGNVLALLGYNNLSGIDMSEGMLEKARARGCYSDLRQGVLGEPLDFPDGAFDAILSTGTFTNGHAPASAFHELTRILEPGGFLLFTVGTVIWEEQGFRTVLENLVRARKLVAVEATPMYRPMPFSPAEGDFTTRAHVYRKV
ncbi:MAG: class I SAM-dependent methyltransferase [Rhizobiales bacterium]|nr:class I SAM-dependent methyltransferase [Hyphomicrobiales bacterium]